MAPPERRDDSDDRRDPNTLSAVERPADSERGREQAPGSPPCVDVLVVEDDVDIRDTLAQVLEAEGYTVALAANGSDALEILRSAASQPCVILLDLMMPVMDGWKFREQQMNDPSLADIPVVILTADGRPDAKVAMAHAADGLTKPVRLDHLLRVVSQYCRR